MELHRPQVPEPDVQRTEPQPRCSEDQAAPSSSWTVKGGGPLQAAVVTRHVGAQLPDGKELWPPIPVGQVPLTQEDTS